MHHVTCTASDTRRLTSPERHLVVLFTREPIMMKRNAICHASPALLVIPDIQTELLGYIRHLPLARSTKVEEGGSPPTAENRARILLATA
jgi:hypothetical protein